MPVTSDSPSQCVGPDRFVQVPALAPTLARPRCNPCISYTPPCISSNPCTAQVLLNDASFDDPSVSPVVRQVRRLGLGSGLARGHVSVHACYLLCMCQAVCPVLADIPLTLFHKTLKIHFVSPVFSKCRYCWLVCDGDEWTALGVP